MVELNATGIGDLTKEFEALMKAKASSEELNKWLELVKAKFPTATKFIGEASEKVNALKESIKQLIEVNLPEELNNVIDTFDNLEERIESSIPAFKKFGAAIALASPQWLGKSDVPNAFKNWKNAAIDTEGSITNSTAAIQKLIGTDYKWLAALSQSADAGKQMEMGMISLSASVGGLSNFIGKSGENIANLTPKALQLSDATRVIGNATGVSIDKVAEFAKILGGKIPGALNDFGNQSVIAGKKMTMLEGAMTVAAGTGRSTEEVLAEMGSMYETMGIKGKPALEIISKITRASEALEMPFANVNKFAGEASKSFALYANSMEAAAKMSDTTINILGKLGPALKASGLGPQAIENLVKGVTDGISQMNTAQKAFLSGQTGGAGGLQGAFQIDQMISEGKIDQVFDKVRKNMMDKLGAPIVTRAQAAMDPGAAAQFQKQLMFMTSKEMGGIAKDDASAAKLLEAMSSGNMKDLPEALKSKDEILQSTMARGQSIQERSNSILTTIANNTAHMANIGAASNYGLVRAGLGEGNAGLKNYRREQREASGRNIAAPKTTEEAALKALPSKDGALAAAKGGIKGIKDKLFNAAEGVVDPMPGVAGVKWKPPTQSPRTPKQMASAALYQTPEQRQKAEQQRAQQPQQAQPIQVNVQTICKECNKKIAKEEIEKHNHVEKNKTTQEKFTPNNG